MSIVTDLSVNKKWKLRQGDDNEFTVSFVDSSSDAFDVSSYVFSLNITNFNNKAINVLQLTEGSGIANGGASGVVTFSITAVQSALLKNSYYYEIDAVFPDTTNHVLFQGKAIVNDYEYTGATSTGVTATVNLSGSDVTATISISGGSSVTVIDDFTTGGSEAAGSAEKVKELKELSDAEIAGFNLKHNFLLPSDPLMIKLDSDFTITEISPEPGLTATTLLSDNITPYTIGDTVAAYDYLTITTDLSGLISIKGNIL